MYVAGQSHVYFCDSELIVPFEFEEASQYSQQCLDFLDDGSSSVFDITESELFLFLVIVIQMGYKICDKET
jgi:hypothetical protein